LPAAEVEAAPSIPWFAAIQGIKRQQDLAALAPKGCSISAEAVEHVVGQIGKSQKASRELGGGIVSRFDGLPDGAGHVSSFVCAAVRCWICVETA
jgi:hypothetical protein